MARTRSPDYELSRDAILAKAVVAFAKQGYPSASMAQIAKDCGVSKATLYHYYENKEAMLFDLLNRHTLQLVDVARTICNDPIYELVPKVRLQKLIVAFMAQYRHSRDMHVVLLNNVKFLNTEQQAIVVAHERQVISYFSQALAFSFPQTINASNKTALTMALLGSINFTFTWLRDDGPVSHEQFALWVSQLWIQGMERGQFNFSNEMP
jgi:AcrR family transcriptional regulator